MNKIGGCLHFCYWSLFDWLVFPLDFYLENLLLLLLLSSEALINLELELMKVAFKRVLFFLSNLLSQIGFFVIKKKESACIFIVYAEQGLIWNIFFEQSERLIQQGRSMLGFSFPFGLVSISGYLAPEKEFHLLASVLFGIFLCDIVYRLTRLISLLTVEGYDKLSKAEKVEWNNRGFSTVHAIAVAFASFYLVVLSGTFHEDHRDEPIISRRSTFSNTTLGISIGYFLSDLGMILWYFPALGGLEYVLHHALSMYSIFLSLLSGKGHIYILMVLFSESTTPFVNMRWYLDVAGKKNSNLYVVNGAALFLGWLVARILLFIYFFVHMFIHFDQVKTIFPLGFYSVLVVAPMLATMNLIWFWKITKGLIKTVSKAKHSQ